MQELLLILAIAGVSLLTSFLCSLLEACIYSVRVSRIETLRRSGDPRAETLQRLRRQIDEAIAAILITNTIANTLGASLAGAMVARYFGNFWFGVFSAVFIGGVLFFAEIVPKSLGVRFSNALAPHITFPLRSLIWVLYPLVRLCITLPRLWAPKDRGDDHGSEEDLISFAHLVQSQGGIHPQEAEWVTNALMLNDYCAYDLMTPNPVVARVPASMPLDPATVEADHWRFSRLPVCTDEDPDKIIGVVQRSRVFDALAQDRFDATVPELMDPPVFVPRDMPANVLLEEFLQKRRHLFCVLDENEQFTGVVTLEDVLESMLGREIVDETDLHEDMQAVARRRRQALLEGRRPPVRR